MNRTIQNIGLMLTKNERDVIEEVMREHKKYFDRILVIDGSTDGTYEYLSSLKQVTLILRDEEISPAGPIRDGVRDVLIRKAQERYGIEGWFTILHGDEIFYDDPNKIVLLAEDEGLDLVRWRVMNFFLHTSEEKNFKEREDYTKAIQERRRWYCPDWSEIRQFRNTSNVSYVLNSHSSLVPSGINRYKINTNLPVLKHYSCRTPEQILERAQDRVSSGFAKHFAWALNGESVFRDRFQQYESVEYFNGDFGKYEFNGNTLVNLYRSMLDDIKKKFPHIQQMDEKNQGTFIEELLERLSEKRGDTTEQS